jgi:hypothetical protein
MRPVPSAPIAAGSLIAGYAVASASGSRPLGGAVLFAGAACCVRLWSSRRGPRTAARLAGAELAAFILSHVIARGIGAWPAVLLVSAAMALVAWTAADARPAGAAEAL